MVVDPAEQPFVAPAAEVAKGRAFGRQILRDQAPRDAPAQHVEDGIQDLAGGPHGRATARGRLRHERGNHPPLRICQVCFVTKAGAAMLPPGNRGPHGTSRSGFSTRLESPPSRILNPLSPVSGRALSRSLSAPAAHVERARALLAIADGASYTAAARQVGRGHNETISAWVSRFNREGLAAVQPGHGGGPRIRYGAEAQQRILAEWARTPQREQDGTATWSLSLLQKALRHAPDGLPKVSTFTIWRTLHEAGLSWQKSRTWCETGVVMRQRKHGVVRVSDPDAAAKKS